MNRKDIIRMAREAGCLGPGEGGDPDGLWEPMGHENVTELMFLFAALVAAAEREACAQVCDHMVMYGPVAEVQTRYNKAYADCRDAIRARRRL